MGDGAGGAGNERWRNEARNGNTERSEAEEEEMSKKGKLWNEQMGNEIKGTEMRQIIEKSGDVEAENEVKRKRLVFNMSAAVVVLRKSWEWGAWYAHTRSEKSCVK